MLKLFLEDSNLFSFEQAKLKLRERERERDAHNSDAVALDVVGPEAVLQERAIRGQQLPQLSLSERASQVPHVEDVAGRLLGWGGAALLARLCGTATHWIPVVHTSFHLCFQIIPAFCVIL